MKVLRKNLAYYMGDIIDLNLLEKNDQSIFLKNTFNFFKNSMLAFQKYINLKNFKIFDLVNTSKRLEISSITWVETFTRFKEVVGDYSFKNLTLEVKDYKSLKNEEFQAATSLEEWKLIKKMKTENGTRFPILSRLVEILFTLSFSTAEIERVFSTLKLTKTPLRNKLADETLNQGMGFGHVSIPKFFYPNSILSILYQFLFLYQFYNFSINDQISRGQ